MIVRRVKCIKVVIDVLDFGAVDGDEPHASEDFDAFIGELGNGMAVTAAAAAAGKSKIHSITFFIRRFQLVDRFIERILNLIPPGVESASGIFPLFRRNGTHFFG